MDNDLAIKQGIDDIQAIEDAFEIPRGYFDSLIQEEDWSFLIKCHTLIESACTRMLTLYFGKTQLDRIFSSMAMGHEGSGKMAFISCLKLLTPKHIKFITCLSKLRNVVIHDVSNVNFSLANYLHSLSKSELQPYLKSLNVRDMSISINEEELVSGDKLILRYPSYVIWSSTLDSLSKIHLESVAGVFRNERVNKYLEAIKTDNAMNKIYLDAKKISLRLQK